MGLFGGIKEPVFLKEDSCAKERLNQLEELLPRVPESIKKQVEQEIRNVKAGISGEEQIAFELRNSHIPMYILHDLYLEHEGLTAQIDYLLVTQTCTFIVECKNLFGDIEINNNGDFIRTISFHGRCRREGLYSPITQNRRHLALIRQMLGAQNKNIIRKTKFERYFYEIYRSVVVLANPKTVLNARYAKKEVKAQVVRSDGLIEYIKRTNETSEVNAGSSKDMQRRAEFFLSCHKENPVDYTARFEEIASQVEQNPQNMNRVEEDVMICPKCGSPMVRRVAAKGANAGNEFWGCSQFPKCRGVVNIK